MRNQISAPPGVWLIGCLASADCDSSRLSHPVQVCSLSSDSFGAVRLLIYSHLFRGGVFGHYSLVRFRDSVGRWLDPTPNIHSAPLPIIHRSIRSLVMRPLDFNFPLLGLFLICL